VTREPSPFLVRAADTTSWAYYAPGVMTEPALRRATYEDLVGVPSHLIAEIVDGRFLTSPRPAPARTLVASTLGAELHGPFHRGRGGPGGWILLDEPELHLGGDVLVPDIVGWRRERMPELPQTAAFLSAGLASKAN
jgi:hypothetical protein